MPSMCKTCHASLQLTHDPKEGTLSISCHCKGDPSVDKFGFPTRGIVGIINVNKPSSVAPVPRVKRRLTFKRRLRTPSTSPSASSVPSSLPSSSWMKALTKEQSETINAITQFLTDPNQHRDPTLQESQVILKLLVNAMSRYGTNACDLWHAVGMMRGCDTEDCKESTTKHIRGALCRFAGVKQFPTCGVTNPPSAERLEALRDLPDDVGTEHFREHAAKFLDAAKRLGIF